MCKTPFLYSEHRFLVCAGAIDQACLLGDITRDGVMVARKPHELKVGKFKSSSLDNSQPTKSKYRLGKVFLCLQVNFGSSFFLLRLKNKMLLNGNSYLNETLLVEYFHIKNKIIDCRGFKIQN